MTRPQLGRRYWRFGYRLFLFTNLFQEINHYTIELLRFFHIQMVGCAWNHHLLRTHNISFELIRYRKNKFYILAAHNNQRRHMYL